MLETVNNPENEADGTREIPFGRELWIERADFMEDPPKKFFRLGPGRLGRLKSAYIIQVDDFKKDEKGEVTELHCTYFPDSKSGQDTSGLKPKATLHWVSADHAIRAEVRQYDRLLAVEKPADDPRDLLKLLNPNSLSVVKNALLEPSLADAKPGDHFQFFRLGYFTPDSKSKEGALVFNRTATLRDGWKKAKGKD
jgi:glutaminyl-tRNA synthetase